MTLSFAKADGEGATDYFLRLQRFQQQDKNRPILNDEERNLLDDRLHVAAFPARVEVGDLRLLSPNGWVAMKAALEAIDSQTVLDCKEEINELVRGCPDTKVVWMWFGYGMPDRVEPDETDATQTCKEEISDLIRGLASPKDRDVILLWPRLTMPD